MSFQVTLLASKITSADTDNMRMGSAIIHVRTDASQPSDKHIERLAEYALQTEDFERQHDCYLAYIGESNVIAAASGEYYVHALWTGEAGERPDDPLDKADEEYDRVRGN
jgi:hypothetical protein